MVQGIPISEVTMSTILWVGQILVGSMPAVRKHLHYRVVHVNLVENIVFIRAVYSACPKASSSAKKYSIKDIERRIHDGKLVEIAEDIRPPEMGEVRPDPEEEQEARQVQDYRIRELGNLITPEGRENFYASKAARSKSMREQAEKVGVSVARLWMLVTVYENFGCNILALRPYPVSETRKSGVTVRKRGAKNVFEKSDSLSALKGYAVTQWALRKIQWAVWHLVIRMGLTYETARIVMHRRFWSQVNGSVAEGNRVQYPVSESKMVSSSQFAYFARRYKRSPDKLKALVGDRDWRDRLAPGRGVAADLTLGPGDLIVMDCTTAKFEIVSATSALPIGRPTLAVVVDTGSDAVLGISVSTFPENANLYRAALFRACTSKKDLMRALGLPEGTLSLCADPNDIFLDRGAGNSNTFRDPLVVEDRPNTGLLIAPIACGRAKGVAEGLINIIIRRLSKLRGGFTRERTARAKDRRRDAHRVANITRLKFLKYAVEAAHEHNQGLAIHNLSFHMRRSGIHPSREEIYKAGMLSRRGGEVKVYSEIDLYTGLLPRLPPRAMRREGVKHFDACFTSPEYQRAYEVQIAKALGEKHKLPKIIPLRDPDDPTILFWKRGPGDFVKLLCSATDRERWDTLHAEDVEFSLRESDQQTRIVDERKKTFTAPLPSYVTDLLINARKTVFGRVSEEDQSIARSDERAQEKREARAESRANSERVSSDRDPAISSVEAVGDSSGGAKKHPVDDEGLEEEVRVARADRERLRREGMKKFLGKK